MIIFFFLFSFFHWFLLKTIIKKNLLLPSQDHSTELTVNAIRSLTFAAITTTVKLQLVRCPQIDQLLTSLIQMTYHQSEEMQMAALQLLTVLAETKYGRGSLRSKVGEFEAVAEVNGDRKSVLEAVEVLVRVILWTPWSSQLKFNINNSSYF